MTIASSAVPFSIETSRTAGSAPFGGRFDRSLGGQDPSQFADILGSAGEAAADEVPTEPKKAPPTQKVDEDAEDSERTEVDPSAVPLVGNPGVATGSAPLTIRSYTDQLLYGGGAGRAQTPAPATKPQSKAEPSAGRDDGRTGQSSDANVGSDSTPNSTSEVKEGAAKPSPAAPPPHPLSSLVRAGEAVRQQEQPKHHAASSSTSQATKQAAAQVSAVSTAGAPVSVQPAASAAAGAKTNSSGIAPMAGVQAGAQGPKHGGTMLRSGVAPRTMTAHTPETMEAFRAQMSRNMATAIEKGEGTLTMRLKPEALGQLHVKVSMKDGVLNARFEAETREARDLLVSTVGELRRSLEASGVVVERIEAAVSPHLRPAGQDGPALEFLDPSLGQFVDAETESGGTGGGAHGRDGHGTERGMRDTDVAPHSRDERMAAEPTMEGIDWLALGVDMIA